MQIILTKDVDNLGYANDIVDVKPGRKRRWIYGAAAAAACIAMLLMHKASFTS